MAAYILGLYSLLNMKYVTVKMTHPAHPNETLWMSRLSSFYKDNKVTIDIVYNHQLTLTIPCLSLVVVVVATSITVSKLRATLAWRQETANNPSSGEASRGGTTNKPSGQAGSGGTANNPSGQAGSGGTANNPSSGQAGSGWTANKASSGQAGSGGTANKPSSGQASSGGTANKPSSGQASSSGTANKASTGQASSGGTANKASTGQASSGGTANKPSSGQTSSGGTKNNVLYSSQREIKAVLRSDTLTHNEKMNCTYLNNSKS